MPFQILILITYSAFFLPTQIVLYIFFLKFLLPFTPFLVQHGKVTESSQFEMPNSCVRGGKRVGGKGMDPQKPLFPGETTYKKSPSLELSITQISCLIL